MQTASSICIVSDEKIALILTKLCNVSDYSDFVPFRQTQGLVEITWKILEDKSQWYSYSYLKANIT